MPGLIRGVARTAVISATATTVSNRVSRRQGQRWAAQGQQVVATPEPPAAPAAQAQSDDDVLAQLERLGALRDSGVLTEEEFAMQKARILRV
ncbi:MAG TPA: SHOCT domain-containing protein [Kineosporiaceae bacterium]